MGVANSQKEILTANPDQIAVFNRTLFENLLHRAKTYGEDKNYEEMLRWSSTAAWFASRKGWFGDLSSQSMEWEMIRAAQSLPIPIRGRHRHSRPRWLHVFTEAYGTLGHTNLCRRWIQFDSQTIHDVALLDQNSRTPGNLVDAVRRAGGTCLILDPLAPFLERAEKLRDYAWQNADVVVLHVHPDDVIATAAFGVPGGPPVLFVNHADHSFWVGCSVADLVLDIRTSGHKWTKESRGVGRAVVLPLPLVQSLGEPDDNLSDPYQKRKIRRELGIPEEGIMFLTVGSAAKYDPVLGHDFVQTAVEILRECPDAQLIAVGPGDEGRWREARFATGGRLRAMGRQPDSTLFCKAADVYLEGFPAGSLTALLEAGESGLPFVRGLASFAPPYSSDGFGIDEVMQPIDSTDYVRTAVNLARDSKARIELGRKLQQIIRSKYCGTGWLTQLEAVKKLIPENHDVYLDFNPTPVDRQRRDWQTKYLHAKGYSFTKSGLVTEAFVEAWRRTNESPQVDGVLWEKLMRIELNDNLRNNSWVGFRDSNALSRLNARIRDQGFRRRSIDRASLAISCGKRDLARKLTYRLLLAQSSCVWDFGWLKLFAKINGGYQIRDLFRKIVKLGRFSAQPVKP
jgi:hypothetical protein